MGVENFNDFENLKDEDWLNAFEMNVLSAVKFTKTLTTSNEIELPRALNVSSVVSSAPGYFNPHYSHQISSNTSNSPLSKKYAQNKILFNSILLSYSLRWI